MATLTGKGFRKSTGMRSAQSQGLNFEVLHGRQVMFLVEVGIAVVLGILSFFLLPANLSKANLLTSKDRNHAIRRIELDVSNVATRMRH